MNTATLEVPTDAERVLEIIEAGKGNALCWVRTRLGLDADGHVVFEATAHDLHGVGIYGSTGGETADTGRARLGGGPITEPINWYAHFDYADRAIIEQLARSPEEEK
jgi:hypothetical protein